MTLKQVFLATQIELNKVQAPSLSLIDFNYLANKAVNQYVNKCYTMVYDVNQQATDDLRVLKATAYLKPTKPMENEQALRVDRGANASSYLSTLHTQIQSLDGATYEVTMPSDYLHLLNCICVYYVEKQKDCWDAGSYIQIPATRLTADSWGLVVNDIYNRPTPTRPYYYLHNVNTTVEEPTNIYNSGVSGTTDFVDTDVSYKIEEINEYWKKSTDGFLYMSDDSKLKGLTAYNQDVSKTPATDETTKWYLDTNSNLKTDVYQTGNSEPTACYVQECKTLSLAAQARGEVVDIEWASGIIAKEADLPDNPKTGTKYMINFVVTTTTGKQAPCSIGTKVNDEWEYQDISANLGCMYNNHFYTHQSSWEDQGLNDLTEPIYVLATVAKEENRIVKATLAHNAPRTFVFNKNITSAVEKPSYVRHANVAQVRMEIRYGRDDSIFKLKEVRVDYLKAPQHLRLSQEQFDLTEDVSQMMEFPDYVNQEIINELVYLVMEHNNDPRLSNNIKMTQSIARPTGQQTQSAQA